MNKLKNIKTTSIVLSLILSLFSFAMLFTVVFAWYNGQTYIGKTMSYSRRIYIGATSSEIKTYYGTLDEDDNFIYSLIDPEIGFECNNLFPSSYIHLRTDIENISSNNSIVVSLFLQGVTYDAVLNDFLYFGTSSPITTRERYKDTATYNEISQQYAIDSIPLLRTQSIDGGDTMSLYWYVLIDSDATLEIKNSSISLGSLTLTYNS